PRAGSGTSTTVRRSTMPRSPRSCGSTSARRCRLADVDALPTWFQALIARLRDARVEDFSRLPTPDDVGREAAPLVVLGAEPGPGPDLLVLHRGATLRKPPGQPAFPGGAAD